MSTLNAIVAMLLSQDDFANKYSHLLEPIRDLAANWNVDIARTLEDYLVGWVVLSSRKQPRYYMPCVHRAHEELQSPFILCLCWVDGLSSKAASKPSRVSVGLLYSLPVTFAATLLGSDLQRIQPNLTAM